MLRPRRPLHGLRCLLSSGRVPVVVVEGGGGDGLSRGGGYPPPPPVLSFRGAKGAEGKSFLNCRALKTPEKIIYWAKAH